MTLYTSRSMSPRDGDPMIVLREPIRSISRRQFALIVALAATVAVFLVGTNLPARRHGEAYAASRYIPFKGVKLEMGRAGL